MACYLSSLQHMGSAVAANKAEFDSCVFWLNYAVLELVSYWLHTELDV